MCFCDGGNSPQYIGGGEGIASEKEHDGSLGRGWHSDQFI